MSEGCLIFVCMRYQFSFLMHKKPRVIYFIKLFEQVILITQIVYINKVNVPMRVDTIGKERGSYSTRMKVRFLPS